MAVEFVSLNEIRNTQPSLDDVESRSVIAAIVEGGFKDWVRYDSAIHSRVYEKAEMYVNRHAAWSIDGIDTFYTTNPLHVLKTTSIETINDEQVECDVYGLLYSNGAVILVDRPDILRTVLYIDEETIKIFKYPKPS